MNKTKITIEADISADIKKIWDCYTRPEYITKWNYASYDWHCPSAENDFRVGGKSKSRMEAKDGSAGFDFEAIYDEIINGKKIAYTILDGRHVTIDFENHGNNTKVTVTFDAESENPVEMQIAGWQTILNNFKKYVESN
jgi:uncharacterized protein YndB with AHSA1/START domain